jgi:hypothetical protein
MLPVHRNVVAKFIFLVWRPAAATITLNIDPGGKAALIARFINGASGLLKRFEIEGLALSTNTEGLKLG